MARRLTRGTLPAAVYWRRRLFVLGVVGAIVFLGFGVIRGLGGEPESDAPVAEQAAAEPTATQTVSPNTGKQKGKNGKRGQAADPGAMAGTTTGPAYGPSYDPSLAGAQPEGACDPADIVIAPRVLDQVVGQEVTIGLALSTVTSPACTWRLSGKTAAVKITDGETEIWTSQQCPAAIPRHDLVVRRGIATVVEFAWNARKSDDNCAKGTDRAPAGDYTVNAAAFGGEPSSDTFNLLKPTDPSTAQPTAPPTTPTTAPTTTATTAPTTQPTKKNGGGGESDPLGQN